MAVDLHSASGNLTGNPPNRKEANGAGASGRRLSSWKDIAAYFQRDIRSVQLWEKKEGLPVHRHEHTGHASVYAYTEELEGWLRARSMKPTVEGIAETHPRLRLPHREPTNRWRTWWLAVTLLACAGTGVLVRQAMVHLRPVPLTSRMLAVLPFTNLTPPNAPPGQDFLADGLTEALITQLGRNGRLAVMSSRSTIQFRGSRDSAQKIAKQLHVTLILDGTVAQEGTSVRVTAQLLDAQGERQLWAGAYSRTQSSVLALQDEIATQIAGDVTRAMAAAPH